LNYSKLFEYLDNVRSVTFKYSRISRIVLLSRPRSPRGLHMEKFLHHTNISPRGRISNTSFSHSTVDLPA